MRRKIIGGLAAILMLTLLGLTGPASAKEGFPGQSYCSGATGPDGVVDPGDPATWNSPGEIISYLAPNQVTGGGPDSVGAVALLCNPNINPLPA
jgi:hypothetical protein